MQPWTFSTGSGPGEAAHGAEFSDASGGPPSCRALLGEFLAQMGRIEADFTLRWEAAQLDASARSAHQRVSRSGWPYDV
ncbi:hypothetical protein [Streptomyces sp. NBC_01190]|uniref:hypothetical protein n=1 Tax=Streptomyces sp. NBC_01190 TaxID=2903767 RepID=UPI00386E4BC5|nr:hypothetical protein OG519_08390 [Streptomyces sp. NBC_01190]